jgi:hypothetical protein
MRGRKSFADHPIKIACAAVSATAILFITVVFPIFTKIDQEKIIDLTAQLTKLKGVEAQNTQLQKAITQLTLERDSLKIGDVFSGGNPYPLGYRLVRIGDPSTSVMSAYSELKPTMKEAWIDVEGGNPLFGSVAFYKNTNDRGHSIVGRILFQTVVLVDSDVGNGAKLTLPKDNRALILMKLIETFGQPDATKVRDGQIIDSCWADRSGVDISMPFEGLVLDKSEKKPVTQWCE